MRDGRNPFGNDGLWDLSEGQEAYLDWLTGARPIREDQKPESKQQFADRIGVNITTLWRWEKNTAFRRAWDLKMRQEAASPATIGDLLEVQRRRAMGGDTKAFEAYMKAIGQMAPDSLVIKDERTSAEELTDEELDAQLDELATRRARKAAGDG